MTDERNAGALVVMPTPAVVTAGPVATWITAAGWAAAARKRFGHAWMVTPEGVLTPEQARELASREPKKGRRRRWRRFVPRTAATLRKDLLAVYKTARFHRAAMQGPWDYVPLKFVWQHHELFHRAGFAAAKKFGVPLVLFVDAPLVWEGKKWGVERPGWGGLLEQVGEAPQLKKADLVACVSDEVANEVLRLGADEKRTIVTPCSVDVDVFRPGVGRAETRAHYGFSDDEVVVGWVGSFRRFHGVDMLLRAFAAERARLPKARLFLVGDGLERARMEQLAAEIGLGSAVFSGMVSHSEIPASLAAMDISLVVDPARGEFHYSPLKMKEYMASGLAVIAPRSGYMSRWLHDGSDAFLVPPGDEGALSASLVQLYADPGLRRRLGQAARRRAEDEGSWDQQIERVMDKLGIR